MRWRRTPLARCPRNRMAKPTAAHRHVAADQLDTEFHRSLGLYDSTMVVVGSMIGSGIFIVSADMARLIGSPGWLLMAWVLTGVLTIVGALSYGELAAMMPRAGGQYIYLRDAFSPLWGFLYGWTLIMVIQTGTIAAVAVGVRPLPRRAVAGHLGVELPDRARSTSPRATRCRSRRRSSWASSSSRSSRGPTRAGSRSARSSRTSSPPPRRERCSP